MTFISKRRGKFGKVLAIIKLIIDKSIPTAYKENQESVEIERYSMTGEV